MEEETEKWGRGREGGSSTTLVGNIYDLRFSVTSVTGSEIEIKLQVSHRGVEVHRSYLS